MAGWQPIETAPKDGTHILLYSAGASEDKQCVGHFYKLHLTRSQRQQGLTDWEGFLCVPDGTAVRSEPTHWQPLPEAPTHVGSINQLRPSNSCATR